MTQDKPFPHWCHRCGHQFQDYGNVSECADCRAASILTYGTPIRWQMGGE